MCVYMSRANTFHKDIITFISVGVKNGNTSVCVFFCFTDSCFRFWYLLDLESQHFNFFFFFFLNKDHHTK